MGAWKNRKRKYWAYTEKSLRKDDEESFTINSDSKQDEKYY